MNPKHPSKEYRKISEEEYMQASCEEQHILIWVFYKLFLILLKWTLRNPTRTGKHMTLLLCKLGKIRPCMTCIVFFWY